MSTAKHLRHILVVDDETGRRTFGLEAATYSVGRDPTNAITVTGEGVSRQHAILLRVPQAGNYSFRIMDGNSEGKPSLNGIKINGRRTASHALVNQDEIVFAPDVTASYYSIEMTDSDYETYTKSPSFRSIKSHTVDGQETVVT